MRAHAGCAVPLCRDGLRDGAAAHDAAQRPGGVRREDVRSEQAARRPAVHPVGQVGEARPAGRELAALGPAPRREDDTHSRWLRLLCRTPAVRRRGHASPQFEVAAQTQLAQAAQGNGHWPDGTRSSRIDRCGRLAPRMDIELAGPERPRCLQHRRDHHDNLGVQAPCGTEHPKHHFGSCAGAVAGGCPGRAAELLKLPRGWAPAGGPIRASGRAGGRPHQAPPPEGHGQAAEPCKSATGQLHPRRGHRLPAPSARDRNDPEVADLSARPDRRRLTL